MIKRIHSGGPFEARVGYCRAVVAGGFVHVAGTVAAEAVVAGAGGDDVVVQCRSALEIIERALAEAGSGFDRAVRVTYYLPDGADFAPCWPVLAETFGAHPPAATMLVCALIDPKYKIEIELTALATQPR